MAILRRRFVVLGKPTSPGRLATPGRLELPAYGLGNRRSILLSYGVCGYSNFFRSSFRLLARLYSLTQADFFDQIPFWQTSNIGRVDLGRISERALIGRPTPNWETAAFSGLGRPSNPAELWGLRIFGLLSRVPMFAQVARLFDGRTSLHLAKMRRSCTSKLYQSTDDRVECRAESLTVGGQHG